MKIGGGLQADMLVRLLVRSPRILVSADSEVAFVPVQDGGTVQIYRVALNGDISFAPILSGERSCLPLPWGVTKYSSQPAPFTIPNSLHWLTSKVATKCRSVRSIRRWSVVGMRPGSSGYALPAATANRLKAGLCCPIVATPPTQLCSTFTVDPTLALGIS